MAIHHELPIKVTADDLIQASYVGNDALVLGGVRVDRAWFYNRTTGDAWINGGTCLSLEAAECLAEDINYAQLGGQLSEAFDMQHGVRYRVHGDNTDTIDIVAGPYEQHVLIGDLGEKGIQGYKVARKVTPWM